MSGARERILAALAGSGAADPGPGPEPARARGSPAELRARFESEATRAAAELHAIEGLALLPAAVASRLAALGLGRRIAAAPGGGLADLDWAKAGLEVRFGPAAPGDAVSVTPALAGVAETGSLLVRSGGQTPNSLHLLPDTHIAVLRAADIVGGYGAGLARLQAEDNEGLPRAATLITGPSRSSDIERIVQIGVHGPRRLIIYLVDDQTDT